MTARALLLAGVAALLAGCGASEAGESSCGPLYQHAGASWELRSVAVAPVVGAAAGVIDVPACEDVEGLHQGGGDRLHLAEVAGASPDAALAVVERPDAILLPAGAEPPDGLAALFEPVACDPDDAPLRLAGPWRGIGFVRAGDPTLTPPYDVHLLAAEATPARYRRALLAVRVPETLGRPISEQQWRAFDGRAAWTVAVEATCDGAGGYVASSVTAAPRG